MLPSRVVPFGEAALLVIFGDEPDLALNARVHALARDLDNQPIGGLRNLVPGYVSLLVEFDPQHAYAEDLVDELHARAELTAEAKPFSTGKLHMIPTVYGGECGPDLEDVATRLHMPPAEVVEQHTAAEMQIYMIGFSPGYPYIGDLPERMRLPRRDTPRERVPAGSVAIAGLQTGIYTRDMPGGWHIIGRTPLPLFDEHRSPPAYLAAGDRVRFVTIESRDWSRYAAPPADW